MKVKPFDPASPQGTIQRDETLALKIHGKLGPSNSLGEARLGVSKLGDSKPMAGIYMRRKIGYNQYTGPPDSETGEIIVKMRSYRPTNPQTVPQQTWRTVFANGMAAWQGLTDGQKHEYNVRGSRIGRSGVNLFMRKYLQSHR